MHFKETPSGFYFGASALLRGDILSTLANSDLEKVQGRMYVRTRRGFPAMGRAAAPKVGYVQ
jgi:hypothetical protein